MSYIEVPAENTQRQESGFKSHAGCLPARGPKRILSHGIVGNLEAATVAAARMKLPHSPSQRETVGVGFSVATQCPLPYIQMVAARAKG